MKRILATSVIYCFFVATSSAQGIAVSLNTNADPFPIVIGDGVGPDTLVISIQDETGSPSATDFLSSWQVELMIIPDPGSSVGTLGFSSFDLPNPYIFDGRTTFGFNAFSGISSVVNPNDTLFATDAIVENPFTGGEQVPTSPGTVLLEIELEPFGGASGTFGIFATPFGTSLWTDSTVPPTELPYVNIGSGVDKVRIGTVDVIIPEPRSLAVWGLLGAVGMLVYGNGRRR